MYIKLCVEIFTYELKKNKKVPFCESVSRLIGSCRYNKLKTRVKFASNLYTS